MQDRTRQYAPTLDGIRPDHVSRYKFAANRIRQRKVLDLACGCGYGSSILHQAGNEVTGVDISDEAISYAQQHYQGPTYLCQSAEETKGTFDAIVSLETLEHLDKPEVVLAVDAPLIIASVPNEERYPFSVERFAFDKYPHKRHYTPDEFESLLNSSGFKVLERFCQPDKGGRIEEGTDGLFLIYIAIRR